MAVAVLQLKVSLRVMRAPAVARLRCYFLVSGVAVGGLIMVGKVRIWGREVRVPLGLLLKMKDPKVSVGFGVSTIC